MNIGMSGGSIGRLSFAMWIAIAATGPVVAAGTQRTFVASTGNDGNPCSVASPCRSFGGAIAKTNPGGEVVVLDSAGYGPVSITQSVTITAPTGIYAGISVFSGSGVTVNGSNISVTLRGLAINFQAGNPAYGIEFANGTQLIVDRCRISGEFTAAINQEPMIGNLLVRDTLVEGAPNTIGDGIATSGVAVVDHVSITGEADNGVHISDQGTVTMRDSSVIGTGGNAIYAISHSGEQVFLTLDRVTINNANTGVQVYAAGALSRAYVDMIRSNIVNSSHAAMESIAQTSGYANVHITESLVSRNQYGLMTADSGQLTASGNTIVNNGIGMQAYTANGMFSMGNNQVRDNLTNLNGTPITVLTFN